MRCAHWLPFCSVTLVLAGCVAVPPTGPSVLALPTAGKNLAVFSQDDSSCRGYAQLQSGGAAPQQATTRNTVAGSAPRAAPPPARATDQ